jgi:putative flippase GtrA
MPPSTRPRPVRARPARYLAVATLGAAVQAFVVVGATRAGCTPVAATILGIEAAILHNFAWHDRWTWGDRPRRGSRTARLARYNLAMAGTSLLLGAVVTWLVIAGLGWSVLPANAVAVAVAAIANYLTSDRVIFRLTERAAADLGAAPQGETTREAVL